MTEETKVPYLFVATPMYGGLCNGTYATAMMRMAPIFSQNKMAFAYAHMMNESLITRARNSLAADFLDSECTHLMFIDADIGFNPADIIHMVDADKDIICGLYPKKEINWHQVIDAVKADVPAHELHDYTGVFVMNAIDHAGQVHVKLNEPIEISNGGTGFMLIKREVFEGLADKVPSYFNDVYAVVDPDKKPREIKEFFATSIDEETGNRLLSEDYHFCKIARKAGYKVWAAPWAQLSHTGSYVFSGFLPRA